MPKPIKTWWTDLEGDFSGKRCKQLFCTHFNLRNLYTDGCTTSLPYNGRDIGPAAGNWTRVLKLANEDSVFCDTSSKKKHSIDPANGCNERTCRDIDVTTFGNLCVDIVLNVPTLPPATYDEKLAYMNSLAISLPGETFWEAGGNSNFAIAAARLGLHCAALGHVGYEKFGSFLHEVLEKEGVQVIRLEEEDIQEETLVCWVLVDSNHRHGFCSRFDFNKDPAFTWIKELPVCAKETILRSKVLFFNGFLFDELTPDMITLAVDFANETGCVVFFDPGPRGNSLCKGPVSQQQALRKLLSCSDVLLLTADEAKALTGLEDPVLSAKDLLAKGKRTKWVIVKLGERGCLMTTAHNVYQVPAFKVDIKDTVGCGDSFAAAIALGYTRKLPIVSMLALANAVGAATAMGCGAGRNVATLNDVTNILLSSNVCGDCYVFDEVQAISSQQLTKVGIPQTPSAKSNMPFHLITREAANLLLNSAQTSSCT
ncbi:hypothetical protein GOP47_0017299 [Adiantum capillus-veneris]|uniref:Carbohydrate kinase PfkB domain-containing protein n=1 Tax=Adiantum capillus-veneris TaxID=13818 RepID=A0A9D4UF26_ADICA|nr:hypothetical protein GOP47_0017299 [Adiantum capillus-veneris]